MIVPVMAISNLVLIEQIYSEETNGAHAHNRDHVPLRFPVSHIFSYTVVKFCPTVRERLLASGQPIPRQRKVIVLSSDSLVSFCTILKASMTVTRF